MQCPFEECCGELRCLETRADRNPNSKDVIRYRVCMKCGRRFVTKETIIARLKPCPNP